MKVLLASISLLVTLSLAQNYPTIPGWEIIGMGFDATTMQQKLLPVVSIPQPQPVSECSSNEGCGPLCWQNPIYPDLKFLIPETVCIQNQDESLIINGSVAINNYTDIQDFYSHTTSSSSWFGFSSKSSTTVKFFGEYYINDYALNFVYQYHAWYQLTLLPLPPPQLHPLTAKIIANLPATYNSDNTTEEYLAYRSFLNRFGTHYVATALMGGKQQSETWFHKCFFTTYNATWVENQSGWSFFGIINDNTGEYTYNGTLSGDFVEYSTATVSYLGGDPYAYNATQFQEWTLSVKDNPAAVDYTLEPIYTLITDSDRAASMKMAFTDYFSDAGEEMTNYVNSLIPQDPNTHPSWCTD